MLTKGISGKAQRSRKTRMGTRYATYRTNKNEASLLKENTGQLKSHGTAMRGIKLSYPSGDEEA